MCLKAKGWFIVQRHFHSVQRKKLKSILSWFYFDNEFLIIKIIRL